MHCILTYPLPIHCPPSLVDVVCLCVVKCAVWMIYGNIRAKPPIPVGLSLQGDSILKRGLVGDDASAVLEIPKILPVVLCCRPPAGGRLKTDGIAPETMPQTEPTAFPVASDPRLIVGTH